MIGRVSRLLTTSPAGFYCEAGGFHIDPWRAVDRAVLTHAHSDHCRPGSKSYLIATRGLAVTRARLGINADLQTLDYGAPLDINGVRVSVHPAGHVLGSAQVRLEHRGQVVVVSGDYKRQIDPTCEPFELVPCHHFITEATFGLPVYRWDEPAQVFDQINRWWRGNAVEGRTSVIFAYSLGKSQRLLAGVDRTIGPLLTHGAVERLVNAYRKTGVSMPATRNPTKADKAELKSGLVIAPGSTAGSPWMKRFGDYSSASASGWMCVRGQRRRGGLDRGFVLSDHADWNDLIQTIKQTGAETVGVTHGFIAPLTRYLTEIGLNAYAVETRFAGDRAEEPDDEPQE
jgi:putative mRNA 3-end processing factor